MGCGVLFGIFCIGTIMEYLPMCLLHPLYYTDWINYGSGFDETAR